MLLFPFYYFAIIIQTVVNVVDTTSSKYKCIRRSPVPFPPPLFPILSPTSLIIINMLAVLR